MLANTTFSLLLRQQRSMMLRHSSSLMQCQAMTFTRSFRKILLMQDVDNLGFKGEWAFVKPGYAFNKLVPEGKALFATDPAVL